jgi:hypothetical protein
MAKIRDLAARTWTAAEIRALSDHQIKRLTTAITIEYQTENLAWRELLLRDLPWVILEPRIYDVYRIMQRLVSEASRSNATEESQAVADKARKILDDIGNSKQLWYRTPKTLLQQIIGPPPGMK